MTEHVVSADDPRIAAFRAVRDPELVRRRGLFIAEGRLVVRRAIEDGRFRVREVLVNEAAFAQLSDALGRLPPQVMVYVCDAAVISALTGFNIHRGCLAIVERPAARSVEEVIAGARTVVALEAVANADNVGGVFRNAAAFACDAVVLSPACCDPFYRKAIRTSMGAALRVPFAIASDWPATIGRIREAGFAIAALTPRGPALALDAFARARPPRLALVAGSEGVGLSGDVEATADVRVQIPISDAVDSLNVATAVAIALYEVSRE